MGFNKISEYSFSCDECGEYHVYHGWRRKDAEASVRADGWSINGDKAKCPEHRKQTNINQQEY